MKNSTTTYNAIFESDFIPTSDARKALKVQTVIGSNGTITTNLVMEFKSDKSTAKGYIKALAFNVSNDSMKLLVDALVSSQKALTAETKKTPALSARPQTTATVALSGDKQVDALRKAGLTDDQITALGINIPKKTASPKDIESDIFNQVMALLTPAQLKKIKGGANNGKK